MSSTQFNKGPSYGLSAEVKNRVSEGAPGGRSAAQGPRRAPGALGEPKAEGHPKVHLRHLRARPKGRLEGARPLSSPDLSRVSGGPLPQGHPTAQGF